MNHVYPTFGCKKENGRYFVTFFWFLDDMFFFRKKTSNHQIIYTCSWKKNLWHQYQNRLNVWHFIPSRWRSPSPMRFRVLFWWKCRLARICRLIIGMQWCDNVGTCHNYLTLNRNSSRINKLMRNVTWKVNTLLISHETLFPGYARFLGPHQVILRPTLVEICSWWSKQISCFGSWSMSQKCRMLGISIMSVIYTLYPGKTNIFPLGIILGSTLHFQWPKHTGLQQLPEYQVTRIQLQNCVLQFNWSWSCELSFINISTYIMCIKCT